MSLKHVGMLVLLSILLVGLVQTSEPAVQAPETQRAEEIELASASLANFSTEFKLAFSNPGTKGQKQNTHVLLYIFDWPGVHVNRVLSGLPSLREMMTAINLHIGLLTLNRTEILKGGEQPETT